MYLKYGHYSEVFFGIHAGIHSQVMQACWTLSHMQSMAVKLRFRVAISELSPEAVGWVTENLVQAPLPQEKLETELHVPCGQ